MGYIAFFIIFTSGMALVSRICGGGKPKIPFGLPHWIYSIPFAIITAPFIGYWSILVYFLTMVGKRLGHGGFFDLGTWPHPRDKEKLEYLILWLKGRVSERTYDTIGLALTGVFVPLPAAVALASVNPLASLVLLISGALKASAYRIGWYYHTGNHGGRATIMGECLTGAYNALGIIMAYMLIH